MLQRLLLALIDSKNEAADDLLLEGLRLGSESERAVVFDTLIRCQSRRGLQQPDKL